MEEKTQNRKSGNAQEKLGALDALKKMFKKLGVGLDELEDGRLGFHYGDKDQDEYLVVIASNDNIMINILDYGWYELNKWDIEAVADIQKKINNVNFGSRAKVVYTYNDEDKMILTSIISMPFSEDIPGLESYFNAQLEALLNTHLIIETPADEENVNIDNGENQEKEGEK